ncbi:MAG: hypothetical protein JWP25_5595 [Bradyrhizobium sp.]|nr:hypothetical protein [Bradyrhizobium sp.]
MDTVCPICESEAQSLDPTGDAPGFHCQQHGNFKVAGTVFENAPTKNASREQWEAALTKAKAKAKPGEWPHITTNDFATS